MAVQINCRPPIQILLSASSTFSKLNLAKFRITVQIICIFFTQPNMFFFSPIEFTLKLYKFMTLKGKNGRPNQLPSSHPNFIVSQQHILQTKFGQISDHCPNNLHFFHTTKYVNRSSSHRSGAGTFLSFWLLWSEGREEERMEKSQLRVKSAAGLSPPPPPSASAAFFMARPREWECECRLPCHTFLPSIPFLILFPSAAGTISCYSNISQPPAALSVLSVLIFHY